MARGNADGHVGIADRQSGWVGRLPGALHPYAELARWDRPIGTWLLLLPCWWGVLLAPGPPDLGLILLFAVGAVAMRGAGCTINDMADRGFDARVARTRNRPLASGRVSMAGASLFLGAQLLVGLVVLLNLNQAAILIGFAIMPVVVAYPFMKRITYWPQVFLGIAFNWGALVGYAAVTGGVDAAALALYLAGVAWTLGYDTVYAHQDKEDDALIGVKSTALLFGATTPAWLWGFYAAMLALLVTAGLLAGLGFGFYLVLPLAGLALARQTRGLRLDDPAACLAAFRAHRGIGLLVAAALLAGKLGR